MEEEAAAEEPVNDTPEAQPYTPKQAKVKKEINKDLAALETSAEALVRLTPTGKISHAKTRVYTQRYRKEWEQMTDFKGSLNNYFYSTHLLWRSILTADFCFRRLVDIGAVPGYTSLL